MQIEAAVKGAGSACTWAAGGIPCESPVCRTAVSASGSLYGSISFAEGHICTFSLIWVWMKRIVLSIVASNQPHVPKSYGVDTENTARIGKKGGRQLEK